MLYPAAGLCTNWLVYRLHLIPKVPSFSCRSNLNETHSGSFSRWWRSRRIAKSKTADPMRWISKSCKSLRIRSKFHMIVLLAESQVRFAKLKRTSVINMFYKYGFIYTHMCLVFICWLWSVYSLRAISDNFASSSCKVVFIITPWIIRNNLFILNFRRQIR